MSDFAADMARSRKFLPAMKRIVGEHLIGEAPTEEDTQRNTDLIVLRLEAVRIACRVRTWDYFERFPDDFTIRHGRPNGVKTELAKIIEGWGDYFLYGFADEYDIALHAWALCNLRVFRLWFNRQMALNRGVIPGKLLPNRDGSSDFLAFKLGNLPPEFIVHRHVARDEPVPF